MRENNKEDILTPNTKSNEYHRNDLIKTKNQLPVIKEKTNFKSKPLIEKFKFNPECKKNIALLQNKKLCTCSALEEYYKNEGCIFINYYGRILLIDCLSH